jgi:hypothetical protein
MKRHAWHTILLISLTLAALTFSQNKPAPGPAGNQTRPFMLMRIICLQPGMQNEWQDFTKNEYIPAMKKAGVTQLFTLRRATFGEGMEIIQVQSIKDLSELDGPNPLVKALGQEAANALNSKLPRLISGYRMLGIVARPDLGIAMASGYSPKLLAQQITTVAPGRTADFEKFSRAQKEVTKTLTTVKGVLVDKVILGGNVNEYHAFVLADSYGDLGKFSAAYAKAAEEAKLGPMPAGTIMHEERAVYRFVPELSIVPSSPMP